MAFEKKLYRARPLFRPGLNKVVLGRGMRGRGRDEMGFEGFYDRNNNDDGNDKIIIVALRTRALDTY